MLYTNMYKLYLINEKDIAILIHLRFQFPFKLELE